MRLSVTRARAKPQLTSSALPAAASSAEIDRHVRRSLHEGSSLYALDSACSSASPRSDRYPRTVRRVRGVVRDRGARRAKRCVRDPRVVSLEPSSLEDVFANILTVGELTGTAERARAVVAELRLRVDGAYARTSRAAAAANARARVDRSADERRPLDAGTRRASGRRTAARAPRRELAGARAGTRSLAAIARRDPRRAMRLRSRAHTLRAVAELTAIEALERLRARARRSASSRSTATPTSIVRARARR
jgi:hypothetical protein